MYGDGISGPDTGISQLALAPVASVLNGIKLILIIKQHLLSETLTIISNVR